MSFGDVNGKVIFVTGAANGIGRAIVDLSLKEGASVIAMDIEEKTLDELRALFQKVGFAERFMTAVGDVTDEADVANAIKKGIDKFGRLDGAVSNADIGGDYNEIADLSAKEYDRVVKFNQYGTYYVLKHAMAHMRKQKSGSIVCVSSNVGIRGCANISAYAASKWAVRGMVKSVALEGSNLGIRVNSICPGMIDTRHSYPLFDLLSSGEPDAARKTVEEKIPMKRFGRPEEIASTVLFILSDAASYTTGAEILVDGGLTTKC